jgi:hypothetical protein
MQKGSKLNEFLISFFSMLILLIIVPLPQNLYADFKLYEQDEFKVILTPIVTLEEEYTDNFFLSRDKESEWITTADLGFYFSLMHPKGSIDFNFAAGFEYIADETSFDLEGSQNQNLSTTIQVTPRLSLSLDSRYRRTNDIILDETREYEEYARERSYRRDNRETLNRIENSPRLTYRFSEENSFTISYRNVISSSDDSDEDDFQEHYIETRLRYWFSMENGIQLSFGYNKGNFDTDTDLLNSYIFAGQFTHRFTPHLEVYLGGSVELADFEEVKTLILSEENGTIVSTLIREDLDDEDIYRCNFGFTYDFSPTLSLEGRFGYFWREGAVEDEDGFDTGISLYKTMRKLSFSLDWENGYETEYFAYRDSGSYEYWEISTDITYSYSNRLTFSFRGSYGFDDFEDFRSLDEFQTSARENREDYIYRTRLNINYQLFENIFLNFEFRHDETDSNQDEEYYIVNRCIGRITATF